MDIELEFKIINEVDNYNGGLDVSDIMVTLEDGNDLNNRLKKLIQIMNLMVVEFILNLIKEEVLHKAIVQKNKIYQ